MARERSLTIVGAIALLSPAVGAQQPQGRIVGWDSASLGLLNGIPSGDDFVEVSAGGGESYPFAIGRRANGNVAPWGSTQSHLNLGPQAPAGTLYSQVSCGYTHGMALTTTKKIYVWGMATTAGNCPSNCILNVPAGTNDSNWKAVSAGENWCLALKDNPGQPDDGTLLVWPTDVSAWSVYPPPSPVAGHKFIAISAGAHFGMALQDDGYLRVWGGTGYENECDTNGPDSVRPPDMGMPVIAFGAGHCTAYAIAPDAMGAFKAFAFGGTMCCRQRDIPRRDWWGLSDISGGYSFGLGLRTGGGPGNLSVWGGSQPLPPEPCLYHGCVNGFGQDDNPYANQEFIAFARGSSNPIGLGIIKVPPPVSD